jgi:hypothetical protein
MGHPALGAGIEPKSASLATRLTSLDWLVVEANIGQILYRAA